MIKHDTVTSSKLVEAQEKVDSREYLFDNMKSLLIFLVVFAHVLDTAKFPFTIVKTLYLFIYFFHMPAFLFISGYFSKNLDKCRETALKNYFIPYVVVNSISFIQMRYVIMSPEDVLQFRLFTPLFGCWFLLALFVLKLLLKDIVRIRFILVLLTAFGIFSGFSHEFTTKFTLGRLAGFAIFFVAGYFVKKEHIEKIRQMPKWISFLFILLAAAVSYVVVLRNFVPLNQTHMKSYYREGFETDDMLFRILLYAVAFLMIFVLIHLTGKKKNYFTKIGTNSITIYILHLFVIRYINLFYEEYNIFAQSSEFVYLAAVLLASVVITFLFSRDWVLNAYNFILRMIKRIILVDYDKKNIQQKKDT